MTWTIDPQFRSAPPGWRSAYALVGQPPAGAPRKGMPWDVHEDRMLLQRYRELAVYLQGDALWVALSQHHGRSACSVRTRCAAIIAGARLARVAGTETQAAKPF